MLDWLINLIGTSFNHYGYVIVFVAMLLENSVGAGSLVPGDTILILGGFYARTEHLNILILIALGIGGALLGDNIGYLIGRFGGQKLQRHLKKRWKSMHRRLSAAQGYFAKHGGKTVLFGRNVAFIRTYVPFLAGVGKMSYRRFAIFNFIGASLQISVLLLIGYFFGQYRDHIEKILKGWGLLLLLIALGIFLYRRRFARRKPSQ